MNYSRPVHQIRVQRMMRPSEINFTHQFISKQFRESRQGSKPILEKTFEDLLYGRRIINEMPRIVVIELGEKENKEKWVLQGNRRLYIYKKLEEFGRINLISVYLQSEDELAMEKFNRSYTTVNGGRSVTVRGCRNMDQRLKAIFEKWVEEGSPKHAMAHGTYVPSIHGSKGANRRHRYREKEELFSMVSAPLDESTKKKFKIGRLQKQLKEQLKVD